MLPSRGFGKTSWKAVNRIRSDMATKLKRFYGYVSGELPLWFIGLLTNWMPDRPTTCRLRGLLGKLFFKKCGRNLQYGTHVRFTHPEGMEIGNDVYIAGGCWLSGGGGLVLEDEVVIGPYTIIATADHRLEHGSIRFGGAVRAAVRIGKGSWLAAHVVVTAGVTIGRGNIVGANAVVTKDTTDNVLVGGVPAKVIRELEDDSDGDKVEA
jgi:maltose O-acetyltransferase